MPKQVGADKHRESRTLGEAVGAELTRLRVARRWSQQQLADELGYTQRYIGQLARGTKSPTLRTLADMAIDRSFRYPSGGGAATAQRKTLIFLLV